MLVLYVGVQESKTETGVGRQNVSQANDGDGGTVGSGFLSFRKGKCLVEHLVST